MALLKGEVMIRNKYDVAKWVLSKAKGIETYEQYRAYIALADNFHRQFNLDTFYEQGDCDLMNMILQPMWGKKFGKHRVLIYPYNPLGRRY